MVRWGAATGSGGGGDFHGVADGGEAAASEELARERVAPAHGVREANGLGLVPVLGRDVDADQPQHVAQRHLATCPYNGTGWASAAVSPGLVGVDENDGQGWLTVVSIGPSARTTRVSTRRSTSSGV